MAGLSIDVMGVNEIVADLERTSAILPAGVRVVVQKTCADTKRDAQAFCPVRTGFLRSSISYETSESSDGAEGVVGPTASYGRYVEEGTSRMAPRAYMGPAFDRNAGSFVSAMEALANSL